MNQFLHKAAAIGFLTLLLLWIIGLFVAPVPAAVDPTSASSQADLTYSREVISRLQVANNVQKLKLEAVPAPLLLDRPEADDIQIHEKSAQMTSSSRAFDTDEKEIRLAIAGQDAKVLNERSSGIEGQRRLALEISVSPERFEDLTSRLRKIGRLETVSVQQRDCTAEFRRLRTQQQWLKKQREEVSKVRSGKEASAEDQLRVLQKLHEIEKELRAVADQAGDMLGKESYYHVYLTLSEEQPRDPNHVINSIPRRVWNGLLWALPWWFVVIAAMGLVPATYLSFRTLLRRSQPTD